MKHKGLFKNWYFYLEKKKNFYLFSSSKNPTLMSTNNLDYSEMYRTQETIQLNKRLRKTRNILLICSVALVAGAGVFWTMPETSFTVNNFFVYSGLAAVMIVLSMYSNKQPYFSILAALILCVVLWGTEVLLNNVEDFLIEGSVHKLLIISLLVSCFHSSREAELIRKELHFS